MQPAKRISTDAQAPSGPGRFVLGLGGTIDDEVVWDPQLIQRLAIEHGLRRGDCDSRQPIRDERSLLAVILGFALERSGGERFVESIDVITRFASKHDKTITLGGTCVRAALAMRTLGVRSTVHLVSIDSTFRQLFPRDCDYISSATREGMYPHLIVQLPETGRIELIDGPVSIEGPNRLIFVNDPPHIEMALSPDLSEVVCRAQGVLISGLNVMNDPGLVDRRLQELRSAVAGRSPATVVLYEDAGFHTPSLHEAVRSAIASMVDVYSMNEDELQSHLGRTVDLLDPAAVDEALRDLRVLIPGPAIVVHTRHWALAWGPRSPELAAALRGGVAAATARYLSGDDLTAELVAGIAELEPPPAGSAFAQAIERIAAEPVACVPAYSLSVETPTTIGLGDCFVGGFLAALSTQPSPERIPQ